jgi:agmatine deiminase
MLQTSVLPADFEPHDAILLAFRGEQAEPFERTLCDIVAAISPHTTVIIVVPDRPTQNALTDKLHKAKANIARVVFCHFSVDTLWARDYGPFSLRTVDQSVKWLDARYTAERPHDEHLPTALGRHLTIPVTRTSVNLWGGAILSNGAGLCVASTTVLERNATLGVSEEQVRRAIAKFFGAEQIVFLEPLQGETTGDVDWFLAFTAADTVVLGDYGAGDPVNAAILNRNAERLAQVDSLRVVRIPMPPRGDGEFFGGTYTNVVFANGVLLVPTWRNASADVQEQAFDTFKRLLPEWQIIGIDATEVGGKCGGLRCLTMPLRGMRDLEKHGDSPKNYQFVR